MGRLNLGAAIAIAIGTGVALAVSMGPVGYALGLALWIGIYGIQRRTGADGC